MRNSLDALCHEWRNALPKWRVIRAEILGYVSMVDLEDMEAALRRMDEIVSDLEKALQKHCDCTMGRKEIPDE